MNRSLVIGGNGFVGSAIVRLLAVRGDAVTVVGRQNHPELARLNIRMVPGDIRDADFLLRTCRGFDTVFHTAAKAGIWGDCREYTSINVNGTANIIRACQINAIPTLVYTSTPSVVFNQQDICGADESLPYASRFLCHYAATKAEAEQLVLGANSAALKTCALRPHLVWGPGDPHLIPRLLERGRRGQLKQVGDGRNRVDISYIDNVAEAHVLAATNLATTATAAGKAYFLSQGEPVILWDWVNDLFARVGVVSVKQRVPFGVAYGAGWLLEYTHGIVARQHEPRMTRFLAEQLAKSHWFSIAAARGDFGYQPRVTTAEGMDRLVAWLRDSGR